MATLVLSTVGNALGGPVGGAIGAMIGQSFDQQLLSPASRGPRVGDLGVQTSSYGTQIPRIYGSMRVAGSIVWATDLAESEETAGAKGQPDAVYSYSVSLAVALSSRPAGAIGPGLVASHRPRLLRYQDLRRVQPGGGLLYQRPSASTTGVQTSRSIL